MTLDFTRRRLLGRAGLLAVPALVGPALLGSPLGSSPADAATSLTAAEWGGDVVEAMKQIAAHQTGGRDELGAVPGRRRRDPAEDQGGLAARRI